MKNERNRWPLFYQWTVFSLENSVVIIDSKDPASQRILYQIFVQNRLSCCPTRTGELHRKLWKISGITGSITGFYSTRMCGRQSTNTLTGMFAYRPMPTTHYVVRWYSIPVVCRYVSVVGFLVFRLRQTFRFSFLVFRHNISSLSKYVDHRVLW